MTAPLERQIIRTAHHEAGHFVVAAAQNLKLRPEGLSVDGERRRTCLLLQGHGRLRHGTRTRHNRHLCGKQYRRIRRL